MIAKHVPMRSLGKSDFASLVRYITDAQSKEHRLGQVQVSNCEAYSARDAISEVLATQYLNTRAESDKTYHLLVSFRAGEQPGAETLQAIEERLCTGLGFGEHQRISAVHTDTDNLHIHIAINKIHPRRHTIHEPYYPHRTLAELCEVLERDYGLQHDNHEPRQRGAAARAADMERHSGLESLVGWIKRACLGEIRGAQSWAELHQVMHDNGLALRARGNGLVIAADDGTMIKASTLARDLSKPALEKRLGAFEASPTAQKAPPAQRRYQKAPVRLRIDTTELYARYQNEQKQRTATRAAALAEAKRRKDRAVASAKQAGVAKRAAIKLLGGGRLSKRLLYAQASASLRADLAAIRQDYDQTRAKLYEGFQRRTWADWLKQEALTGNDQALTALRAREAAQGLTGNTLEGQGQTQPGPAPAIDTITKKGTILYRAGRSAVRDDGDRLQVSREIDRDGVQAALRLAMARYGDRISVTGSPEFKALVIRTAVDARLPLTFADPGLERRRQALMQQRQETRQQPAAWRPGVPPIGQRPLWDPRKGPPSLSQVETLRLDNGEAEQPTPTPTPEPPPAVSEQARRRAKLEAEMAAKQAKRGRPRKGRSQ